MSIVTIPTTTEASFTQDVLRAEQPVLVSFQAATCGVSQAFERLLTELAHEFNDRVRVLRMDVDVGEVLAELYHITAVPTLLVFVAGDVVTRATGFLPKGLLRLLFTQIVQAEIVPEWFWRPTEQVFEETVIIPLLNQWGWNYTRQAPCTQQQGRRSARGRVDFLVFDPAASHPITLIENKRLITNNQELQKAAQQACGYATSLVVPSFIVAAPSNIWVYTCRNKHAQLVRSFSSLQVQMSPHLIRNVVLELGSTTTYT